MAEASVPASARAADTPPPPALPIASTDAAWVAITAPQPAEELLALCRDVEAIVRANPFLTFSVWRQIGPNAYHVEFENESNGQNVALDFEVLPEPDRGLTLRYAGGIKKRTVLVVEPLERGSRLVIVDDYEGLPEEERQARAAEVDRSLAGWGNALRKYFIRIRRWSWVPGWRWYIRRVWVPMKPSARRIVWLIYIITVAEFAFFLFLILIWVIEQNR